MRVQIVEASYAPLKRRRSEPMALISKLTVTISKVHPLVYLLTYLTAIPTFGVLYDTVATHGFYAPYARHEPSGISDTAQLASHIETALRRSFDARAGQEFVVGNWKLLASTLRVTNVRSTDGTYV